MLVDTPPELRLQLVLADLVVTARESQHGNRHGRVTVVFVPLGTQNAGHRDRRSEARFVKIAEQRDVVGSARHLGFCVDVGAARVDVTVRYGPASVDIANDVHLLERLLDGIRAL